MKTPIARSLVPLLIAASLVTFGLCARAGAQSPFARPGDLPAIDARIRAAIVDSVTAVIDTVYVDGDAAVRIAAHLRKQLGSGAYRELTDPAEFVLKLEEEAQSINRDGHFGMRAMFLPDPALGEEPADSLRHERRRRRMREANFGFDKVEILPGNVGYLKLDMFADTGDAAETAAGAMNFLGNARALIIDLRQNGGGTASMIRLLAGYLFAESTHLINWDIRARGETVQSWSADVVPGRRLDDVPVYVLTSRSTFSAAEEFTFDLKHLERATIVGDTTGGGGNTVSQHFFDFDDFRVGMRVPYGHAYDPKTGAGWEGIGVIPHIAVPSEQALQVAHREALKKRLEVEEETPIGEETRFGIEWALQGLESEINPVVLPAERMTEYAGSFGPRQIFLEDGTLYYQREDRPRYRLAPMGTDLFRVGDLEYFRLTFERDDAGRIVKVVGLYDDGRRDENERDADR
jgi:hypothetical protein